MLDPRKYLFKGSVAHEIRASMLDTTPVLVARKSTALMDDYFGLVPFYVHALYEDGQWNDYGNLDSALEFYWRRIWRH